MIAIPQKKVFNLIKRLQMGQKKVFIPEGREFNRNGKYDFFDIKKMYFI